MERSSTRDFVVGLFVLAGIAAIAYLSTSIGGFNWRNPERMKLFAGFDEIGGLAKGAPVVIGGVRVGEISAITLQQDVFRARVEMNVNPTLQLPTDTFASIVTAGVLGDQYIELKPGGEDKLLKDGDTITHTDSAVILEQLISQFIYGSAKGKSTNSASPTTAPATTP
jgi:phospholipid/cholesterol/gamma-HCH transport system substrate-binding protein